MASILIADDHAMFRSGLTLLVESIEGFTVVAEAENGEQAIELAAESQPDVILMDIDMPTMDGLTAAASIYQSNPKIGILMLTMLADGQTLFKAMQAGARGYLLKGASRDELERAVRAVRNGEMLFSADMAHYLTAMMAEGMRLDQSKLFPELTAREFEIFQLVGAGKSNAEIAARLNLTAKTVRNYVSKVLNKLQVVDRTAAVDRAQKAGIS